MKRTALLLPTLLLVVLAFFCVAGLAGAMPGGAPAAGSPTIVSYQGQVSVSGAPYDGLGFFKFAIVDGAGAIAWTNDGSPAAGGEPAAAVQLTVTNGLFSVLLGDSTIQNMTRLLPTVFSAPDRRLRIWFSVKGDTFSLLTPDRRLAAAPYAFQASNADTLDGREGSAYQGRVTGACSAGSTISAINEDGSVVCQPDDMLHRSAAPQDTIVTSIERVTAPGNEPSESAITIGTDGLPVASYYEGNNQALKVLHCGNAACTAGNTLSVVDSGGIFRYNSIAIGVDGYPLIAYHNASLGILKVAHCGDRACASSTAAVVDSASLTVIGEYTSIAIGGDGLPVISYYDATNHRLKLTHCGNADCSADNTSRIVAGGLLTEPYNSMTVGADGRAVIAFYDSGTDDLKFAHCPGYDCALDVLFDIRTIDSTGNVGQYPSLTIGTDGLPVMTYLDVTNGLTKLAHCSDRLCASSTSQGLSIAARTTSLTVGADGLPIFSGSSTAGQPLTVMHCADTTCQDRTTVDLTVSATKSSITVGADGLPVMSYVAPDGLYYSLMIAHCSNTFCTPYFKRR